MMRAQAHTLYAPEHGLSKTQHTLGLLIFLA